MSDDNDQKAAENEVEALKLEGARAIGQTIIQMSQFSVGGKPLGIDKAIDVFRLATEKAVPLVRQAEASAREMIREAGIPLPDYVRDSYTESEFTGQNPAPEAPSSNLDGQ